MFYLRQADKRGRTQTDWLDSRHTFSFGQYYDPRFMAFSDLRVINDDVVAPSGGFGTHPHDNMEIVSVVFAVSVCENVVLVRRTGKIIFFDNRSSLVFVVR